MDNLRLVCSYLREIKDKGCHISGSETSGSRRMVSHRIKDSCGFCIGLGDFVGVGWGGSSCSDVFQSPNSFSGYVLA